MRYLLLVFLLALQGSVFGYSSNNRAENHAQKILTSEKSDLNARSYHFFRYYSPESGTYVSQDPIGLSGGMPNMYSYVFDLNSRIDPYGLMDPWDIAFSQNSISNVIADGPRAGELVEDLIEEAADLGRLPDGLTLNVMELNGGRDIVALNNRTLYIAQEAGLTNIHPNFQDNINKLNKLLDGGMPLPLGEQPEVKIKKC